MLNAQLRNLHSAFLAFCLFTSSTLFAQSYPGANDSFPEGLPEPPNNSPVWNNTPAPVFTEGVTASYDLTDDCSDAESDPLTFVNEAGCSLPSGQSINGINLDEDGTSPEATTTSCVFSCDDGVNSPVDSNAFSIVVSAIPAANTIYERDMFGTPRTGTSGAVETLGPHSGNPIAELNDVVDIEIADYACDVTITTGAANWNDANNVAHEVICIDPGDHSAKGDLILTDPGTIDSVDSISAITLTDPVRVDFTAVHGWSTGDIVHCNDSIGGTWQMRWRFFKVTVIDTDTADFDGQDGTGNGVRPQWTAYTSGGGCSRVNFKVIRHSTDLSVHPVKLASGARAKIRRMDCGNNGAATDYLMVLGLTIDHKGLVASIGSDGNDVYNCDYMIYDKLHFYNDEAISDPSNDWYQHSIHFLVGPGGTTQFTQTQRSVFDERGFSGTGVDSGYWQIAAQPTIGMHFVDNETNSSMSTWQTGLQGDFEGFYYAENTDYLTSAIYTDCDGVLNGGTTFGGNDSSPCAVAETAGAFKGTFSPSDGQVLATTANRHRMLVMDANIQCCRRQEDGILSDGGSGRKSYGFSNPGGTPIMRNVMFRNNIVFANEDGLFQGLTTGSGTTTVQYISNIGNINYALTGTAFQWFTHSGAVQDGYETVFNTVRDAVNWANVRRVTNAQFECNLIIDSGGRLGTKEGSWTQENNYAYGNVTQMDGTGDTDGGAVINANLTDLTIQPKQWTDDTFDFVLTGVLPSASSPHRGDCPDIGAASIGITDDTVTF